MSGRLLGIARRSAMRAPMEALPSAEVTRDGGIASDFRGRVRPGKFPKRQVLIMRREDWDDALAEVGTVVDWTIRRANLMVEGVDLPRVWGTPIAIGSSVVLESTVECDPCFRMDEQLMGLDAALRPDWRGGVLAYVVREGAIAVGDEVRVG